MVYNDRMAPTPMPVAETDRPYQNFLLRLDRELRIWIEAEAKRTGLSMTRIINNAIAARAADQSPYTR